MFSRSSPVWISISSLSLDVKSSKSTVNLTLKGYEFSLKIHAGFTMHVATYVAQYRQTDSNAGVVKPKSPRMHRHMFQRVTFIVSRQCRSREDARPRKAYSAGRVIAKL